MSEAALTSEAAFLRDQQDKIEWGRGNAAIIDAACRWLTAAGVTGLRCREQPR